MLPLRSALMVVVHTGSAPLPVPGWQRGRFRVVGKLIYGPQERVIDMDDRTLAHVKMVVVSKLRRDESFLMTWVVPLEQGSGRDSVWFSHAIPLQFHFDGNRPPAINRAWLDVLMESANRGELHVTAEPDRASSGSPASMEDATNH
jgi:hypothetical protein